MAATDQKPVTSLNNNLGPVDQLRAKERQQHVCAKLQNTHTHTNITVITPV